MFANKEEPHPRPIYSLSPAHLQPLPQPLSEWRGA